MFKVRKEKDEPAKITTSPQSGSKQKRIVSSQGKKEMINSDKHHRKVN